MFIKRDSSNLVDKIVHILQIDENRRDELCQNLRNTVEKEHSVDGLTNKLVDVFKSTIVR